MTVIQLVDRERSRLRAWIALAGGGFGLALAAATLCASVLVLGGARWLALPRVAPFIVWVIVAALVALAGFWAYRHVHEYGSRAGVATLIEHERSLRAGSLRGALEVAGSGLLGARGASAMAHQLGGDRVLAPALRGAMRWRALGAALGAAAAIGVLAAARESRPDGWQALAHPLRAWRGALAEPLEVGAPSAVMRGERVEIEVRAHGRRTVTLFQRATGTGWRTQRLEVDASGVASAVIGPVDAELRLVAGDGRSSSDTVVLAVADRPFLGDVAIQATFPPYLGRADEAIPVGEAARVPRGTVLSISGYASVVLDDAALHRGTDTLRMRPSGHRFTGRMTAAESGRWQWLAHGRGTAITELPPPVELEVLVDSTPQITIVEPASDTLVSASGTVPVLVQAADDHGLASVAIRSWRRSASGSSDPEAMLRVGGDGDQRWSGRTEIDLSTRGLRPGDQLHVVAVAADNSPWRQTAESRELIIRVPTAAEQRAIARDVADSAVASASAAVAAQKQLEQRTADAAQSRGDRSASGQSGSGSSASGDDKSALSYDAGEKARALATEQRAMADRVKELQRAASDVERQLRQAGALDSGLASRLAEAQQLLRDALTPALAEQLRKLEESLQQLSQEGAQRALGDLAAQQRQLREQLERGAEMLKRAALEGAMQTLGDDAKELAQRQRALADSLQSGAATSGAKQSAALEQQSRQLAKEIEQLSQRLADQKAENGARQTGAAGKQAGASADAMQKAAAAAPKDTSAARAGDNALARQNAAQAAQSAAQAMDRAAQQMADARESQIKDWKSELTQELDRSIQEMLQLARQQEQLEQRVRSGTDASTLRGEQSSLQQGVAKAAERLQQAGQKSSLLSPQSQRAAGEAQNRVGQATKDVSESKNAAQTAGTMRDAAEALNRAAASLVRDRERANNASSASGFSEMLQQLQQMAQRQGGLSQEAQGLLQSGLGAGEMQAAARQLAQQQRALARDIDQVDDRMGRAEEFARESRRIADALETGRVDAATIQRQQQLFRRMLDAGRSLEQDQREDTGKREAQSARTTERIIPGATDASGRPVTRFQEPTWNELRGLTADERRAVLEYFKRINGGRTP